MIVVKTLWSLYFSYVITSPVEVEDRCAVSAVSILLKRAQEISCLSVCLQEFAHTAVSVAQLLHLINCLVCFAV